MYAVTVSCDLAAVAPCWCTRAIVESTDTFQSISPFASASACKASSTRSQVPSLLNRACRFQTGRIQGVVATP